MYQVTKFSSPKERMMTCYSPNLIYFKDWLIHEKDRLNKKGKSSEIMRNTKKHIALYVEGEAPDFAPTNVKGDDSNGCK